MKDQITRKGLLNQAFAHLARAEALLLAARAKHEQSSGRGTGNTDDQT